MGLSQKLDTPKIQWGIIMNHHSSTFKWLIDEYLHVSPVFSPKSSRRVWGVPKGRDVPGWLSNVAANYTLMQSWCNINAILMQFSKIYYQPININFIGIPDFLDQWWPMDLCIRINDFLSVICHSSLRGMVEHSSPGHTTAGSGIVWLIEADHAQIDFARFETRHYGWSAEVPVFLRLCQLSLCCYMSPSHPWRKGYSNRVHDPWTGSANGEGEAGTGASSERAAWKWSRL